MSQTILLHGASGNAASWEPVLPAFEGLEVRAVDLPGRGTQEGPALESVEQTAAWLASTLKEPVHVLGHSYGGAVGLQLALDHPHLVRSLFLVASASRLRVHPDILAAVAASTPEAPYRLDAAFGRSALPAVVEQYAALVSSVSPATALADWRACDGFDVRARLSELDLPVCIVHGDADALTIPKHQAALEASLPGSVRVELPGVGHMLPWEAPEQLAAVVRDRLGAL